MDIQAVARLANVSTATVSRVMNNSPMVRPETAEHVLRIVEQTRYVPNRSARQLRVRHSRLFGLIVSDVTNPFFPELIEGFDALAVAHDIDVIFTHTGYSPERLEHCLRRMVERNVDGIAVMTSEFAPEAIGRVQQRGIPLILLDQIPCVGGFANVQTDFDAGYLEAIRHLKELGHKHIAFLCGPTSFASVHHRRDAFTAAMKTCRLGLREEWMRTTDLHVAGGARAARELFQLNRRPTAIVTTNDLMAVGVLQAAHQAGMQVPHDLSVIGFDDLPVASVVNPPLTTIALSRTEIAGRAFAFLFNASKHLGNLPVSKRSIRPQLIVRESTGPPG